METVTFNAIDNNITFTIKAEFAKTCPDFQNTPVRELLETHNMFKFLHNPNGPAVVDMKINKSSYFINGVKVTGDELEKIKHREDFNGRVDQLLNE